MLGDHLLDKPINRFLVFDRIGAGTNSKTSADYEQAVEQIFKFHGINEG
jgi:hypothetical protein